MYLCVIPQTPFIVTLINLSFGKYGIPRMYRSQTDMV